MKLIWRLLAAVLLISLNGPLYAQGGDNQAPRLRPQVGFYLGLGAGISEGYFYGVSKNTQTDPLAFVNPESVEIQKVDWSAHGGDADVFVGYDWHVWQQGYLGVEVFSMHSGMDFNFCQQFNDFRATRAIDRFRGLRVTVPYAAGVALLPGVEIAPGTLFFGRFAYIRARVKLKSRSSLSALSDEDRGLFGAGSTPLIDNTYENGFQLGLGQKVRVSDHLSVITEYDWSKFGNLCTRSVSGPNAFGRRLHRAFKTEHMEFDSLKLAFVYHPFSAENGLTHDIQPLFHGNQFYIGLVTSRDFGRLKQKEFDDRFVVGEREPFQQFVEQYDIALRGFDGGLLMGFGHVFDNRCYLGIEFAASITSANGGRELDSQNNDIDAAFFDEARGELDISGQIGLIPGYFVTPTSLLYGHVALVTTRFHLLETGFSFPALFTDEAFNFDFKSYRPGILLGVGIESFIDSHLSLRTDLNVIRYRRICTPKTLGVGVNVDIQRHFVVKHTAEQIKVALVYHIYSP